jgi:hypothetical protein
MSLSFLTNSARWTGKIIWTGLKSFNHNVSGMAKAFITDDSSGLGIINGQPQRGALTTSGFVVAGASLLATSVCHFTNYLNDKRFSVDIEGNPQALVPASKANFCRDLSFYGMLATPLTILGGLVLKPCSLASKALTATITTASLALMARRYVGKKEINLIMNQDESLGFLSFGKPIFRVNDPTSPYYMMSHFMEGAVKQRELEGNKSLDEIDYYRNLRDTVTDLSEGNLGLG